MSRIMKTIKEEIISAIPAILFFAIAFNLINFTERLMMKPSELSAGYPSYFAANIAALFVGKIIIIANTFSFMNAFSNKPLIYNITWQFIIYGALVLLFRVAEDFISYALHHHSWSASYTYAQSRWTSPYFWAIQMWVLMLFIIYIVSIKLIHAIGKDKFKRMLFG